jgi:hypothetical protein
MAYGTYRNKISRLTKEEKIEFDHSSAGTAYYTMPGHRFSNPMTQNPTGGIASPPVGKQTPLYKWLKNLPTERQALHNIRLRFESPGIWKLFSIKYPDLINPNNQDIQLNPWTFNDDIEITATLHRTDTVTVAVACSDKPIATDVNGLSQTIESLVRTEGEFKNLVQYNMQSVELSSALAPIVPVIKNYNVRQFCKLVQIY